MIEIRRPSTAEDLLAVSRRIDWRLLLTPELGRVAIGERSDPALAEALRRFGSSVTFVRDFGAAPARYDLVVLVDPSRDEIAEAAAALTEGGWLYVQVSALRPRPLRRPRVLPAYARALRRARLNDVTAYWHFPDVVSCEEIVPIAATDALRVSLGRRRMARLPRAKARLAARLARTGLLGYVAREGSVAGRRGAHRMSSPPLTALRELVEGGEELELVLVTPRFTASSNVVAVLVSERTAEPVAVVKIPRLPGPAPRLERETRILRALETARPGGYETVPRVIAVSEWAGRPVLAQTALVGSHMDEYAVRRDLPACIDATLAWLRDLPATDGSEPSHERYERLIVEPLTTLLAGFERIRHDTNMIARTLEVLEPLRTAPLPSVFEHGDLSYPNILRLRDGGVGVVDWELGEERSFPARDLFFFLAFVALARSRARTPRERIAAFHEAYVPPGAWATGIAARYAERLEFDPSLLTPLFLAGWARHSAEWLVRLGVGEPVETDRARSAALYIQGHHSFVFWNHTLRHLDALRWAV